MKAGADCKLARQTLTANHKLLPTIPPEPRSWLGQFLFLGGQKGENCSSTVNKSLGWRGGRNPGETFDHRRPGAKTAQRVWSRARFGGLRQAEHRRKRGELHHGGRNSRPKRDGLFVPADGGGTHTQSGIAHRTAKGRKIQGPVVVIDKFQDSGPARNCGAA